MCLFQFEFEGEEGTGLGPTLEFYSLVAAALQEKSLGIFLCDDDTHDHVEREVNVVNNRVLSRDAKITCIKS